MADKVLKVKVLKKSGDKSLTCQYTSLTKHPKYEKYVKRTRKYMVHDARNAYKEGDEITIREAVPISKMKRWIATYDDEQN